LINTIGEADLDRDSPGGLVQFYEGADMPSSTVDTFTDPDAYHAAIRHAHAEGIVIERGTFGAELTNIQLDRVSLHRSKETLPRVTHSVVDPKLFLMVFPIFSGPALSVNGLEMSYGDIVTFRAGSVGYNRSSSACQWGTVALTQEDLAAVGQAIIGRELTAPPVTRRIKPPAALLSRLLKVHEAAGHLAKTAPDILAQPEVGRALDHALVDALVRCLAGGDPVDERRAYRHHTRVMRRLEEVLRANPEGPLHMADLCKATSVSYGTLYGCAQEHLGMSPKRYLLLRRMHLTWRALRKADAETTTVTEIATNYGFWELGRFSVAYRSLFGESPSTTLRRPPEDPTLRKIAGPRPNFV
jgi:AraC-like DNA-binding protein